MKKTLACVIAGAVFASLGCQAAAPVSSKIIKVGIILTYSGPDASIGESIDRGAELYLTGEMRHHDALKAAQRGMTVVCALHSHSERKVLERFAAKLREKLPTFPVHLSTADRDPFEVR